MNDDELDQAFLTLTASGELDRIFRQLRNAWYGSLAREVVREALGDAMAEVVRLHQDGVQITNLPGLIQTVSRRRLSKIWEATQREDSALEQLAGSLEAEKEDPERTTKVKRAAAHVRTLVPKLDNKNYQLTINAMLDAAEDRRQLTPQQLATAAGCTPNTASKWMERAPQRLLSILKDEGFDSLDSLLNVPPTNHDIDDEEYDDE